MWSVFEWIIPAAKRFAFSSAAERQDRVSAMSAYIMEGMDLSFVIPMQITISIDASLLLLKLVRKIRSGRESFYEGANELKIISTGVICNIYYSDQ